MADEQRFIDAAAAAIDFHTTVADLDDDGDRANVGLWHLLHSLLSYCDAEGVDFDAMLSDVRSPENW